MRGRRHRGLTQLAKCHTTRKQSTWAFNSPSTLASAVQGDEQVYWKRQQSQRGLTEGDNVIDYIVKQPDSSTWIGSSPRHAPIAPSTSPGHSFQYLNSQNTLNNT